MYVAHNPHPFQYIDRSKLTSAACLFGAGLFYPFSDMRSRLMIFGIGFSTLSVAFNPLYGRINPIAEVHLFRFQKTLFKMAVSMLAIAYVLPSTSKPGVKAIQAS